MISELHISNFQSHDNTRMTLHPGVNVIIGSSDNGKSAIMRALKWVKDNSIKDKGDSGSKTVQGISYVSKWVKTPAGAIKKNKECSVTIVKDNTPVTRYRNSSANGYRIGDKPLEAIGVDVPHEISSFINMDKVNVQRQTDPHFLISWSTGDVSKFFNKIVKLEAIDKATSLSDSRKRSINADIKSTKDDISSKEISLKQYDWVLHAEKLISELEVLEKKKAKVNNQYNQLHDILEDIYEYQEEFDGSNWVDKAETVLHEMESTLANWASSVKTANTLKQVYLEVEKFESTIANTNNLAKADKLLKSLKNLSSKHSILVADKRKLFGIIDNVKYHSTNLQNDALTSKQVTTDIKFLEKLRKRIVSKKSDVDSLQKIYNKIVGLNKEIGDTSKLIYKCNEQLPDVCPFCNGSGKCKH